MFRQFSGSNRIGSRFAEDDRSTMDKPDCAELEAILATADEYRATEARLKALKTQGSAQAQALAGITDKRTRLAAATYAYWFAPEINASDLAFGATGRAHPSALNKLMGPVSIGVNCERCDRDLPITSRTQMKAVLDGVQGVARFAEGYRVICTPCREAVLAARDVAYREEDSLRSERQRVLAAMPYADYLETEDWRDQRDSFLSCLIDLRHTDLGCETCGSQGQRGVFHRSLDRLGAGDDLILLCAPCATALQGAGKLAGPPCEGNRLKASTVQRIVAAHDARYDCGPRD